MSETSTDPRQHMNYWRSLQELADTDEYRLQLENEFPGGVDAPPEGMTRRRFLQVMSASVAMVSLAGCRWPEEKIVPYVNRPEGATPGKPLQFATTMELGPVALGVLATSYDGRPIKIDGNPDDVTGPLLEPVLKPLWAAYKALKTALRTAREVFDAREACIARAVPGRPLVERGAVAVVRGRDQGLRVEERDQHGSVCAGSHDRLQHRGDEHGGCDPDVCECDGQQRSGGHLYACAASQSGTWSDDELPGQPCGDPGRCGQWQLCQHSHG